MESRAHPRSIGMNDCLLLNDVFNEFRHPDGEGLLASFRARYGGLLGLVEEARGRAIPIVYANDNMGIWDGNASSLVDRARMGPAGPLIAGIEPRPGDRFVVKPKYSAFHDSPLHLILDALEIERIVLAGMATEMCVTQTAIAARELGYKVTVVPEACATVDEELEQVALTYLERVAGVWLAAGSNSPAGLAEDRYVID